MDENWAVLLSYRSMTMENSISGPYPDPSHIKNLGPIHDIVHSPWIPDIDLRQNGKNFQFWNDLKMIHIESVKWVHMNAFHSLGG